MLTPAALGLASRLQYFQSLTATPLERPPEPEQATPAPPTASPFTALRETRANPSEGQGQSLPPTSPHWLAILCRKKAGTVWDPIGTQALWLWQCKTLWGPRHYGTQCGTYGTQTLWSLQCMVLIYTSNTRGSTGQSDNTQYCSFPRSTPSSALSNCNGPGHTGHQVGDVCLTTPLPPSPLVHRSGDMTSRQTSPHGYQAHTTVSEMKTIEKKTQARERMPNCCWSQGHEFTHPKTVT